MKRIKLLYLLVLTLAFSACEFHQSVNKDLTTGAYSRGNGIGCDEVKIQVHGKFENRNKFIYGEKVNLFFNNVSGLIKKNGKVYPGLSLFIVNNKKDTVMKHSDLFAEMKKGTGLSPLQLNAHFVSTLPCENNEKYKIFIKIWDKKGDGTFHYELPFSVEPNELLTIRSQNMDYSNIYLWDETEKLVVVNKKVSPENEFILIMDGLNGLEVIDNKVYPSFSIEIIDKKGNRILSNANILDKYKEDGLDSDTFINGQLPVIITFSPGQIYNPCKLKASLIDLNSDRRIEIEGELIVK